MLTSTASTWLDCEIDRVWLLTERARGSTDGELVERIGRATAAVGAARLHAPIGRLANRVGLGELELDLLAIAMAVHADPTFGDAFANVHRQHARRGVELALCGELLGLDRAGRLELLDLLDPDRPLCALRLLQLDPDDGRAAGTRAVRACIDALPVLAGRVELSPALRRAARLERPILDELAPSLGARRAALDAEARSLARLAEHGSPPWLVPWGPWGAGKTTLARHVAAAAQRPLLVFDPSAIHDGTGDELLRRAQRDALVHDAVLYVGPVRGDLLAAGGRELGRRLRGFPGMIVLGVESREAPRLNLPVPTHELGLPALDELERRELWSLALPEDRCGPDVDVGALARSYKLTPGDICTIAADATAVNKRVSQEILRAAVHRRLRSELGDLARASDGAGHWHDLVLPADQLERVRELCDRHRLAHRVFQDWRLADRVGYGRGVVALFSGPPGTGKTMLAGLVAAELGLELYKVDLSEVVSKWVGETEKQLARVFDLAERAHAVLLFDEADALLGSRTKVESANDRYGNLAVNYLLSRIEEYDGIAILTTNHESSLDPALQRRLTLHLRLDPPEEAERAALWRSFLPATIPGAGSVDVSKLAEDFELSGGHIKNAVLRAAFLAARDGRSVDTALCHQAARLECHDMGHL